MDQAPGPSQARPDADNYANAGQLPGLLAARGRRTEPRAEATTERYLLLTRLYLIPGFGEKRIDRLQVRDIRTWLNRLRTTCQCCAQQKDAARPESKRRRCCATGACCRA